MTLAAVLQRSLRAALTAVATMLIALAVWADPADPADPRVVALATNLGNNPATIFQYVRDNMALRFTPAACVVRVVCWQAKQAIRWIAPA